MLRNPYSQEFKLKDFYLENIKKSRRLQIKLFYIRGYALYATENELIPIMERFRKNLEMSYDYIDYNYILSVAGLPYLAETYGYSCFVQTLKKANFEYNKINPLLRDYFTLNENLEQVNLISPEEIRNRTQTILHKHITN